MFIEFIIPHSNNLVAIRKSEIFKVEFRDEPDLEGTVLNRYNVWVKCIKSANSRNNTNIYSSDNKASAMKVFRNLLAKLNYIED